jgi:hypothetical protein
LQSQTEQAGLKTDLEKLAIEAQVATSKLTKARYKLIHPHPPEMMTVFAEAVEDKLQMIEEIVQHFTKRLEHGDDTHRIIDYIEWSADRMSWPEVDLLKATENLAKHSGHVSDRIAEKRTFVYLFCGLGGVLAYAFVVCLSATRIQKQHSN